MSLFLSVTDPLQENNNKDIEVVRSNRVYILKLESFLLAFEGIAALIYAQRLWQIFGKILELIWDVTNKNNEKEKENYDNIFNHFCTYTWLDQWSWI